MDNHSFSTESPDNYEQKCCCVLVLDVSSSMRGAPIKELNDGLQAFYHDIQNDSTTANRLEIAVVEFCDVVKTLTDPSLAANFSMPILVTKGTTNLTGGVEEGINIANSRKAWYKQTGQPYYRPWIILITDAMPNEGQDITGLAAKIAEGVLEKNFSFFAIGVEGADMNMLNRISDPSMPPAKLQGLKFSEFFQWLSASMTTITNSKDNDKVSLPDPSNWMKGFSV